MKTMTTLIISAYKSKYRIQKDIDRKQLELEEIEHEKTGLGHHGLDLTPEQARSGKPMPTTTSHIHSETKLLSLIERADELQKEIDYLTLSLNMAKKVDQLSLEDQRLMQDLFHSRKTAETVAQMNGYSVQGMYKRIYSELDKVC